MLAWSSVTSLHFKEGEEVFLPTQNLKVKTVAANARKLIP